jgi:hypothetical protein
MSIQRSQARAGSAAAAFDFDVVTDVPARLSRKPDPQPAAAPNDTGAQREKAESAKA